MFKMFKKAKYMGWKEYRQRVRMIDDFCWSQSVRKRSLRNLGM